MTNIDPVELTRALVKCPSVTPKDEGALDILSEKLRSIGFRCERMTFAEAGADPVQNLYARWGDGEPAFCFAGHTDVVPAGDPDDWATPPFEPTERNGDLYGRGVADMKGAIAAFAAAAERVISRKPTGSIIMLITGDEEGPAINGTRKVLDWMAGAGETISHCLVGEPSSSEALGDMIKVGRRGSMNCWLTVFGAQGHVAYPARANNPIPALLKKLLTLSERALDEGYDRFQPSSLQITDIHVGNPAANVIPARAAARFNIRFNPNWTGESLEAFLRNTLDAAAAAAGVRYELSAVCSGDAFLTTDEAFLNLISTAIKDRTGRTPDHSTTGGTSDARFIKNIAPVCEFGLVGRTIHKIDEHSPIADIASLANVYETILDRYFATFGGPA
ncbi:MAG TPA: succinyl-diaminopimelate desuccinylase [Parvularculaceae bacterium]|nr:succinyl-diaminopimelate desuccinylase [Parvularculaceae bacterium]